MEHSLSTRQQESFKKGDFNPLVLQPGFILYRFCRGRDLRFSDCWMDKDTLKDIFRRYASLYEKAQKRSMVLSKHNIAIFSARDQLAISENWSNLLYLHTVEVKKPLEVYYGTIREQPLYNLPKEKFNPSEIILRGGGKQYVIPQFTEFLNKRNMHAVTNYVRTVEFKVFKETSWFQRLVTADYSL